MGNKNSNYTPFPIYKRPKDDDDNEIKESSLKPHQYLSSKTHPLPKGAVPDLNLFENMEVVEKCKGFSTTKGDDEEIESEEQSVILCPALKRLVAVLNYYNSLMMNAVDGDEIFVQKQFVEFCDKYYSQKWMLEDYMYFISNHSDLESTNQIAAVLEHKCFGDLKRCGMTSRHYRNRQRGDKRINFYVNIMDKLHFNVLHLVDVGLRVNIDWNLKNGKTEGLTDENMLKISREIQMKRQQTTFPRIDGMTQNSKFSLHSTVGSNGDAKGGMTKMESVLRDFQKEVGDNASVHRLIEFLREQRYDTETMNEDMTIYAESKLCNIFNAMRGAVTPKSTHSGIRITVTDSFGNIDSKPRGVPKQKNDPYSSFRAIRWNLRYHRVSGSSFATGIWWIYWPWYKTQTVDSLLHHNVIITPPSKPFKVGVPTLPKRQKVWRGLWDDIEFGGYSLKSLFVEPHFQDLKEEALGSGLISARCWRTLLLKALRYLDSARCKTMIDTNSRAYRLRFIEVNQEFKLSVLHLLALFLYTDLSAFCTAFSETFRAITPDETIEEMNSRNSMYYWTSRYLRELVYCFGSPAGREKRPIFTGISYEMSIPQFKIGLVGPTSTSMSIEVACRFAGSNGMVIMLNGKRSSCFDASVFSEYPEEQERIFCGSTRKQTVASLILVESSKTYTAAIGAYSKFDAIFSGRRPEVMSDLEMKIITESLRWVQGDEDSTMSNKKLDIFILETFYSFIIHKKMVYLNLNRLNEVQNLKNTRKFSQYPETAPRNDTRNGSNEKFLQNLNTILKMVVHPIKSLVFTQNGDIRAKINDNLIKSLVFTLFRDLHQIRIEAHQFPFDLISFLNVIRSVDIPQTLELILIEGTEWLRDGFTVNVKEMYARKGIGAELEEFNEKLVRRGNELFSLKLKTKTLKAPSSEQENLRIVIDAI